MLAPVVVGIREPLFRFAPGTVHLLKLRSALEDFVAKGAGGERFEPEQPLRLRPAADGLPVESCSTVELIETALKVGDPRGGALVILLAAAQCLPAPHASSEMRLARLRRASSLFLDRRQLFTPACYLADRHQRLLEAPEPLHGG